MSEVTKTYKEVIEFEQASRNYLIREGFFDPKTGVFTKTAETKLVANLKSIGKQWKKHYEAFAEQIENLRIDHCLTDEKTGAIIRSGEKGNYTFSKDGERAFNKAYKDLLNKTITLHARITPGNWDLSEDEKEVFSGLVIPEITQVKEPSNQPTSPPAH